MRNRDTVVLHQANKGLTDMSDKQATIADIVAETRAMWQGCEDCPCAGAEVLNNGETGGASHRSRNGEPKAGA